MNKLTTIERAQLLTSLIEGNSIASTTRMFGASKVTILRLIADAGTIALKFHNAMVRDLSTKHVQVDEVWSFVGSNRLRRRATEELGQRNGRLLDVGRNGRRR